MKSKTRTPSITNLISRSPLRRGFLLIALAFICLALSPTAHAQRTIDFIVVTGTPITPAGTVDAGDILIFTGPAKFVTSVGTCAAQPGDSPVQNAVVVDHAGGRATRVIDAIVVGDSGATPPSPPPPVKPGTKLVNLFSLPQCQNGSILYDQYRGTVE